MHVALGPRSPTANGNNGKSQQKKGQTLKTNDCQQHLPSTAPPFPISTMNQLRYFFLFFNYAKMMMYAPLIRHEWEMKGRC